jgi:hypothetical protein
MESGLFWAISRLNHAEQEQWLRAFYLTETAVLCVGALLSVVAELASVLAAADKSLFHAKRAGRNGVVFTAVETIAAAHT